MLAARAVGLDVGGMSGFDNAKVDAEFFPDGRIKSRARQPKRRRSRRSGCLTPRPASRFSSTRGASCTLLS